MIRLLLIESDAASVKHMKEVTAGENAAHMSLALAGSLAEGMAALKSGETDLVLVSLELPDSQGFKTFLRIQAQAPETPIIVLGQASEEDTGRRVVAQGAQDFLARGVIGPAPLRRMVTSAVERQARLNGLRGREDLVRNLAMMNADGVLIIDEDGVIQFSNPAAENLLKKRGMVGASLGYPLDPDDFTEIRLDSKDGAPVTVELRCTRIRWRGKPSLLASARDISDRKRVEEALRSARDSAQEASRAKSDFVANMSHEIRTPINSILGMTEILNETALSKEQKECAEVLSRSGELLLHLINNILDLSKIEAGHLEIERLDFDLFAEAEKVLSTLDYAAKRKGLDLVRDFDRSLGTWRRGDPGRLSQILVNLVNNAIKFTESGSVTLSIGVDESEAGRDRLRFSISDTGIGIPPDKQELIFESFRQADASTARRYGGTGLGLSISRKLIEAMGGILRLDSELGKGSRFHFGIPLPTVETPAQGEGKNGSSAPRNANRARALRILLVDDSADNRMLVQRFLRNSGHAVDEAENGRVAVEQFSARPYDVVLMDIQMPELDGYEATRRIRAVEARRPDARPAAIVALTASVAKEEVRRCLEAGCSSFLGKPVRKIELLDALLDAAPFADSALDIEVSPDPEIADLIPGYLKNRQSDLSELTGALDRRDFEAIAAVAHRIRGSASGYGFEGLSAIARAMEESARARDGRGSGDSIKRMGDYLSRVKVKP